MFGGCGSRERPANQRAPREETRRGVSGRLISGELQEPMRRTDTRRVEWRCMRPSQIWIRCFRMECLEARLNLNHEDDDNSRCADEHALIMAPGVGSAYRPKSHGMRCGRWGRAHRSRYRGEGEHPMGADSSAGRMRLQQADGFRHAIGRRWWPAASGEGFGIPR
jgi:hypothetical protein